MKKRHNVEPNFISFLEKEERKNQLHLIHQGVSFSKNKSL